MDNVSSITQNITLATTGLEGSSINWNSSNSSVITNGGTVTRPVYGSGNKSVTMTATITKGSASDTKTFNNLTVIETLQAGINLLGTYNTPGNAMDVAVSGNYAYVADNTGGFLIINISNPSNPTLAGSYTGETADYVTISGNYAYVSINGARFRIIDISNPSNPTSVGLYTATWDTSGSAVSGNYAYVGDSENGIKIVNISNPSSPTYVSSYDWTNNAVYDVKVSGNYAYIAARPCCGNTIGNILTILNITDPANPVLVNSYSTGVTNSPLGMAISGNYAYITDDSYGLRIINISNPSNLILAGTYDTPGLATGIAISGNYAYVADGASGIHIINISNPSNPTLVLSYDTPGLAYQVAVSGNYIYVADRSSGLQILYWQQ